MKPFLKLTLFTIVASFILASCSKTNDVGKMIPNNASFVMHLNGKSLNSKLSWDEVKASEWFKKLYADTTIKDWMKKLMDNPENSGINIKSDMVFFVTSSDGGAGSIVFEGDVKDAAAFETFNKNLGAAGGITKDGDISSMQIKEDAVASWNSKKFAYVFNSPVPVNQNIFDTTAYAAPAGADVQRLSRISKSLFNLKADSSLGKNDKFSSLLGEDGDLHIWQNTEQMLKGNPALGMLGMLKMDAFIKGNISTATISFDNGAINAKQKLYASKEFMDVLKKYGGGEINTAMIQNIPSKNVAGVLALHFKPEGLAAFIKLTGMDGLINMMLAQQGFSIDDFVSANKGDIMFSVSDIAAAAGNDSRADALFSVAIGDQASFQKLINAGNKLNQMKRDSGIFTAKNDKYFTIGNNQSTVNSYNSGAGNSFPFLEKLKGHPVAMYVDLNRILSSFAMRPTTDTTNKIVLEESVRMWQDIYITGGEIKSDVSHFSAEINLVDKTTNSLKQLNKYFDKLIPVVEARNKRNRETYNYNTDTTVVTP